MVVLNNDTKIIETIIGQHSGSHDVLPSNSATISTSKINFKLKQYNMGQE